MVIQAGDTLEDTDMSSLEFNAERPRLKLMDAIDAAIEASNPPIDGWRAHLGASIIGRPCALQVWYGFRWFKAIQHPARLLRLFDRGQREEERIVGWLRDAGVTVYDTDPNTGEQVRYAPAKFGGHVGGSQDAWGTGIPDAPAAEHIIEFKTANAKSLKQIQDKGCRAAKPEHYTQQQLYMLWSGKRRSLYIVVCKDDDQIYAERLHYDPEHAAAMELKADEILDAELPVHCSRVSDNPTYYMCKPGFCDYSGFCYGDEVPAKNCRTCENSTPLIDETRTDGPLICSVFGKQEIPIAFQRKGCDKLWPIK